MGYAVRMTRPNGPAEYIPPGFGFDNHQHATCESDAALWDSKERAQRALNSYRYPPAFWNSERKHRENVERKFSQWRFEVVEVTQ